MWGYGMPKCHAAVLIVAVVCSKQTFLIVTLLEKSFFFPPSAFQQCFKELKSSFRAEVPLLSLLAGMPPEIV